MIPQYPPLPLRTQCHKCILELKLRSLAVNKFLQHHCQEEFAPVLDTTRWLLLQDWEILVTAQPALPSSSSHLSGWLYPGLKLLYSNPSFLTVTSIHSPCRGCLSYIIYTINMFFLLQSIWRKRKKNILIIFFILFLRLVLSTSGPGCTSIVNQELPYHGVLELLVSFWIYCSVFSRLSDTVTMQ